MKLLLLIMAFGLGAVLAVELDGSKDFTAKHYGQHHQTVEEARRKAGIHGDEYNSFASNHAALGALGAQSGFEEVAAYGGAGSIDAASGYEASLASGSSGFGSGGASSYDASFRAGHSAGLGLSSAASLAAQNSASSYHSSHAAKYGASSGYQAGSSNVQFASDANAGNQVTYGGALSSDSLLHETQDSQRLLHQPSVYYTQPAAGSNYDGYYRNEQISQSHAAPVVQYTPSGASEKFVQHQERFVEQKALPVIQYTVPAGGSSEKYVQIKKITTASQPQIYVHSVPASQSSYLQQSSTSNAANSQLANLLTGTLNSQAALHNAAAQHSTLGYGLGTGYNSHSTFGGSSDLHQYISEAQRIAKERAQGLNAGASHVGAAQLELNSNAESSYGSAANLQSGYSTGSNLYGSSAGQQTDSAYQGSSGYNTGSTGLLAAQNTGYRSGLASSNLGLSGQTAYNANSDLAATGVAGSGYKAKSWEKASKWSTQSQFDSDGHVNNYKELATAESENYDINGQRKGYKAATASVDDNGKVSTYSVHS